MDSANKKTPKQKAFVIGWPISHSLSPALHSFWINELGLDASYEKLAISPRELPEFLREFPDLGFVGGNITIPHKEVAAQIIDQKLPTAQILGAVNTIWKSDGNILADNTDGYGFSANLDEFAPMWRQGKTATVLGAGGASKAIIYAILQAGYENIYIINRTQSRADKLVLQFGSQCHFASFDDLPEILSKTDLMINTTALGMAGQAELEIDLSPLPRTAIVTDIVYNPLETKLLQQAKDKGFHSVDGIGMLLHQAVPGFEKWFGLRPKVTGALRAHVLAKLELKTND